MNKQQIVVATRPRGPAIDPVKVEAGTLRIELLEPVVDEPDPRPDGEPRSQHGRRASVVRLTVRELAPDSAVVEIRGQAGALSTITSGWAAVIVEDSANPASTPHTRGTRQRIPCALRFLGWLSVHGDLQPRAQPDVHRVDGARAGIARVELDAGAMQQALDRLYLRLRFPTLLDPAQLDPATAAAMTQQLGPCVLRRSSTAVAWTDRVGANVAAELSADAIACDRRGRPLGQIRLSRVYPHTWLAHRLRLASAAEADPGAIASCRSALLHYAGTVPALAGRTHDGAEDHLMMVFDRADPAHPPVFDAFTAWFDEPERATIVAFERYQTVEPECDAPIRGRARVVVAPIHPNELDEAAAVIREQLPQLARAAFELERPSDRRGRRVFVAREAGAIVGVGLVEASGNCAQLYLRRHASSAAQRALVACVRSHAPEPLLSVPAGVLEDPAAAGLRLVETLGCMIVAGSALRAYRTFLCGALAKLPAPKPEPGGDTVQTSSSAGRLYLRELEPARRSLLADPRLRRVLDGQLDPVELLGFLLHAAALHLRLAERSDTLRRAGARCLALGQDQPGAELAALASDALADEARRLDDLFALGRCWHAELGVRLPVERLIRQPPPGALLRLLALEDRLAGGAQPASVLAVEHERASALARLAPPLLGRVAVVFGGELRLRSFAVTGPTAGHARSASVALDCAASDPLASALTQSEDDGRALAAAGRMGLGATVDLLGSCVDLGRELAARARATQPDQRVAPLALDWAT